ncbi:HD domain-containing phosphohydrolase [Syntrophomonas wolfei]|uniref:Stage 0 sporulation protein A homolog n=1 Tax=Syntrophomonas wolfei subsp. wolfei (strain DSM 2245B / Goettingen) TaxID=335541 RepID=Q0ATW9_SYNWW|nr:HD domain-containing phosphohydrolase [Syntrophomonas wolfei]ABI69835.1 response regulator receiver protein [Syntrophomonas wolfei subsp. wolfei str. Goettingen G311]
MNKKILLVDDDEKILASYRRQLGLRLELLTANNAEKGWEILQKHGPIAVVISDYKMPGVDGIAFLERVKEIAPDTVRIMLTGYADIDMAINAVNQGNIFRFLTKPCPIKDFVYAIAAALEQYRLICSERELLEQTLKGSIKLLIDILSISKPQEFNQLSRLRNLAKRIALRLNVEKPWELDLALMLSPIGLITIPEYILQKRNSGEYLCPDEEKMYQSHPATAKDLLSNIPRLENVAEAIAYQMKNYHSQEPCSGLAEKEIPLLGRILKVVLDFNTLIKKSWSATYALDYLQKNADYYDPEVLSALIIEVQNLKDWSKEAADGRLIKIKDIKVGMVLLNDLQDDNGLVLLPQGQEISPVLQKRLLNFAEKSRIRDTVRVLEPLGDKAAGNPFGEN